MCVRVWFISSYNYLTSNSAAIVFGRKRKLQKNFHNYKKGQTLMFHRLLVWGRTNMQLHTNEQIQHKPKLVKIGQTKHFIHANMERKFRVRSYHFCPVVLSTLFLCTSFNFIKSLLVYTTRHCFQSGWKRIR